MSDNKEHKIEYRVVRQSKDGDEWLSVQEVYYDDEGDIQGSLENDYYSNSKYDNKKLKKKTKYHIGKFAVIR